MLGNKEGLFTKEEIQTGWKLISEKLPIPKFMKPLVNIIAPGILDGLDNKVGDKIPEPWQTHCEQLATLIVEASRDKVYTLEELEGILEFLAKVVDEKVDIPLIGDDAEALLFLTTAKQLAAVLYSVFNAKKKEIENQ